MSKAAELAREEAERVEREERERNGGAAADGDGVTDLDAIASEGPSEEQVAEMEAENQRHLDALREVMGPAFDLFQECPHCQGVGIGPRGPEPVQYERYRECPTCKGFGQVLTGAREPAVVAVACPGCGGRGFQERQDESGAALPAAPPMTQHEEKWGVPSWMGDPSLSPAPVPPILTS